MALYDIYGVPIDTGGGIAEVVDVTSFGAVGDGVTNDASAIQSAIDSVKNSGGIIFFPCKTYLVNTALLFYSNQILKFAEGATILRGASINNLMRNYNTDDIAEWNGTHDVIIDGGTFDGGTLTSNITLLACCHSQRIVIRNCHFKRSSGSWHDVEINSSKYVKIINCTFDGSAKTGKNGCAVQLDRANDSTSYPWTSNLDGTGCKYVEIADSFFFNDTISPAIGNHSEGTYDFVRIHGNIFDGNTGERGAINFNRVSNCDIYDNTFNGCTIGIGAAGVGYAHDNRFVSATTAISGSVVGHANMINGTYTA